MGLFQVKPKKKSDASSPLLQIIVHDSPSKDHYGRIVCSVPESVWENVESIHWHCSAVSDEEQLDLDVSRLCARKAPVGDYQIELILKGEDVLRATMSVGVIDIPAVVGYEGEHASSGASRDGSVHAIVERVPHGCHYLWSCGVITRAPTLEDAHMGTYTVTLLSEDSSPLPFVHLASAFTLHVAPR